MLTAESESTNVVRQGDIIYVSLFIPDLNRAATFYSTVLGWKLTASDVGDARLVQGQALPHGMAGLETTIKFFAGLGLQLQPNHSPNAYVTLAVDDIEAAVQRVRAAGGQATTPYETPYGRQAECLDDQGLLFGLHQTRGGSRTPATGARQGDVAYLVFEFPDSSRARAFYGEVLGWQFSPGRVQDGWNIADIVPMSGVAGGRSRPRVIPMYRVDNIQAAVGRVRAAGGTSTDPVVQPYGTTADCSDDQGTTFFLGQF